MPLAPIADIRRRELVEAAWEIIKRDGLQFAATAKIEREAGASRGTIHKYFKHREELLERSVRHALAQRQRELVHRLTRSGSPSERLWSIIAVNLHPRYLEPGFSRAWISIVAEGTEKKAYERLVKAVYGREHSNIAHCLRLMRHNIDDTALALQLFFDGSRYRSGFLTKTYAAKEEAQRLMHFMMHNVPRFNRGEAEQEISTWPESQ
jgi:TetR/AcrR family transcriptional repressor of bet genes